MYGPVKERWKIMTDEMDILLGVGTVKFIKSLRLRWCGHVERIQNQRMPKQIAEARTEGAKKRGRHCVIWKKEREEDINIMGRKNRQEMVKDHQQWRMIILEARAHSRP